MSRNRKIHFVVHNQGAYDHQKKEDLLTLIKSKYGEMLEGHLIAQEMYSHDPSDSHLQGNLFFKNAIRFPSLLKLFQSVYAETRTPQGLKGRTELQSIVHEGRAYSYMINANKEGGDPAPICDNTQLDGRKFRDWLNSQLREAIETNIALISQN